MALKISKSHRFWIGQSNHLTKEDHGERSEEGQADLNILGEDCDNVLHLPMGYLL